MNGPNRKLIAIIGPTATGKSDLAVLLARRFNGEVISADSRQIYKGMDLGSAKITKREMRGVPHHLLSVVSPLRTKDFSVFKFKKLADAAIAKIEKHKRLPILAGGTGFWVDAVALNKDFPEVPPNPKLRRQLEKMPVAKLFLILKKLNPQRATNIDAKNPRRLVRAIEIAKFLKGKNFSVEARPTHQVLFIGLDLADKTLEQRISKRLKKRVRQGLVAEVARLHKSGLSWRRLESFGLEYKFVALFLQGKIDKKQLAELLLIATRQYAKRQRTWFKRNPEIHWLNATNKKDLLRRSFSLVSNFL